MKKILVVGSVVIAIAIGVFLASRVHTDDGFVTSKTLSISDVQPHLASCMMLSQIFGIHQESNRATVFFQHSTDGRPGNGEICLVKLNSGKWLIKGEDFRGGAVYKYLISQQEIKRREAEIEKEVEKREKEKEERREKERESGETGVGELGALRSAVVGYYGMYEKWPNPLTEIITAGIIKEIPPARLREGVPNNDSNKVHYGTDPFHDDLNDQGGWLYDPEDGVIIINSTHKDTKGRPYSDY
ncbi:hypothetical protein KKG19_05400 [Patescibacteria group bacterium]|nr:hypothetical protein [Patescibacteria group bacterium]